MIYLSYGATLYPFEGLPIKMRVGVTFGATFYAINIVYSILLSSKKTILKYIFNKTQWGVNTLQSLCNLLKYSS